MGRPYIIAGAGPAGLASAITLARAGMDVEVRERTISAGARYDGNLQMLTNYPDTRDARDEFVEFVPEATVHMWPQTSATLHGPSGKPVVGTSREPFGYLLGRGPGEGCLDGELFRVAELLGVRFRFGEHTDPDEADIIATGGRDVYGVAREWFGDVDLPDGFTVHFDNRDAPGGYGYLLVADGRAVLGAAVTRGHRQVEEWFRRTVQWFSNHYELPNIEAPSLSGRVSLFVPSSGMDARGGRYAGEAGGFCDCFFGFGIRLALQTGRMAAESILSGEDYDTIWKRNLNGRQESAMVNRIIYETIGHPAYRLFISLAARSDFRRLGTLLYRPFLAKRALVPLVKAFGGTRDGGLHGERCAWRRIVG
jgi:flavin-dependent dehydrogenase